MDKKNRNAGLSLVELIVVISIMSVLTGVVAVNVSRHLETSRKAKAISEAETIYTTAKMAVYQASQDVPQAFYYALKYEEDLDGDGVKEARMGRCSSQSLAKYLAEKKAKESGTPIKLSSALSKEADYYIAGEIAESIPKANGEIEGDLLKDTGIVGCKATMKEISDNPATYGNLAFAMAYTSECEIIYFQCVYGGYYIHADADGTLVADKVGDQKFNDWPNTRFKQSKDEKW